VKVEACVIGPFRNYFAKDHEWFELPEGATATDLLSRLNPPRWVDRGPLLIVVNRRIAAPSTPLAEGDRVSFLLPVGGG
jgi:molybdopterin converting factor small subunit